MVDKHELLKQMRKHAKNFSSAVSPVKEVDQKSINRALALIDLFSKESNFGSLKNQSIKIPNFLKILSSNENLDFLKGKSEKNDSFGYSLKTKNRKTGNKFKMAEKKLRKLLSTKSC
tara:strand:+ start:1473 stop:1823 length:351 start_codon:yes stop_codon:yes gene_type:complete